MNMKRKMNRKELESPNPLMAAESSGPAVPPDPAGFTRIDGALHFIHFVHRLRITEYGSMGIRGTQ